MTAIDDWKLYCRLGNSGLDHLHSLRGLQSLNLSYTNITDPGVSLLTALTTLTYLSVDSRLISDEGLAHVTSLISLRALDLFGCKVRHTAVVTFLRRSGHGMCWPDAMHIYTCRSEAVMACG